MIVANIYTKLRQTSSKTDREKLTTVSLLLKNEIEHKNSFKTILSLHVEEKILLKYHIIKTQKNTKKEQSTRKLHSLHPFI